MIERAKTYNIINIWPRLQFVCSFPLLVIWSVGRQVGLSVHIAVFYPSVDAYDEIIQVRIWF